MFFLRIQTCFLSIIAILIYLFYMSVYQIIFYVFVRQLGQKMKNVDMTPNNCWTDKKGKAQFSERDGELTREKKKKNLFGHNKTDQEYQVSLHGAIATTAGRLREISRAQTELLNRHT